MAFCDDSTTPDDCLISQNMSLISVIIYTDHNNRCVTGKEYILISIITNCYVKPNKITLTFTVTISDIRYPQSWLKTTYQYFFLFTITYIAVPLFSYLFVFFKECYAVITCNNNIYYHIQASLDYPGAD